MPHLPGRLAPRRNRGHGEFLFEFEDAQGGFLAAASFGLGELELENFDVGGGTLVHSLVEVGLAASLDKRNW